MKNKYAMTYWFILLVVSIALIVCLLLTLHQNGKECSGNRNIQIKALVRQTARWAVASQQDTSPMVALLHANYAAGYLQALELIARESEINRFHDLMFLRKKVYETQDRAVQKALSACPAYAGEVADKELASLGVGSIPN